MITFMHFCFWCFPSHSSTENKCWSPIQTLLSVRDCAGVDPNCTKTKKRRKKTPGTFENLSPASNLHWAAMTRRVTWALANSFYKAGIMLLDFILFYFFHHWRVFKPTQTSTSVPFCLTTTVLALFTALTWNNISPMILLQYIEHSCTVSTLYSSSTVKADHWFVIGITPTQFQWTAWNVLFVLTD